MSTIQTSFNIVHIDSGLNAGSGVQRTAFESAFSADAITVVTADETISLGDVITARQVVLKLVSGDDLKIGLDGATYPFRLSGNGDCAILPLDVTGIREISSITCGADSAGSLSGDYLDLADRSGTVRVWFSITARPEISTVQTVADSTDSLDGTYFLIYDDIGSVEVWLNTSGGSATAPGVGDRAIEVAIATDATNTAVATALQTAIDADAKFSATVLSNTVTITDASNGARTDIADVDTGFTVAVSQQGVTASTPPATPGGGRLLPVTFAYNDSAATIATALAAALEADDEFTASASTATVTITDQHTGTRTDIVDGTTGWTMSTSQQGAASPVVHLKSDGTSIVVVAVAPN